MRPTYLVIFGDKLVSADSGFRCDRESLKLNTSRGQKFQKICEETLSLNPAKFLVVRLESV